MNEEEPHEWTVREAGRKGGKIGGETTKRRYGPAFYSEIGTKGGRKVRKLVEEGKMIESESEEK